VFGNVLFWVGEELSTDGAGLNCDMNTEVAEEGSVGRVVMTDYF
jgi:hypothetical protein